MPFDSTLPLTDSEMLSNEMRNQFNGLKDLIDAGPTKIGPAGLQITGNTEGAFTIGLVFLKSDGVTDSGYRLNYNDDTDGVLILRDGVPVAGMDAEGLRVFGPAIAHGEVKFTGLPGADPHVAGQLWNDAGTLKVSAG